MKPTSTPSRAQVRPAISPFAIAAAVAAAVVMAAAAWLLAPRLAGPGHIDRLIVVNPFGDPVHVSASGGPDDASLSIGTVDAGSERSFGLVLDQGDTWLFRFRVVGGSLAEVSIPRRELQQNDWRVTIPDVVTGERTDSRAGGP